MEQYTIQDELEMEQKRVFELIHKEELKEFNPYETQEHNLNPYE